MELVYPWTSNSLRHAKQQRVKVFHSCSVVDSPEVLGAATSWDWCLSPRGLCYAGLQNCCCYWCPDCWMTTPTPPQHKDSPASPAEMMESTQLSEPTCHCLWITDVNTPLQAHSNEAERQTKWDALRTCRCFPPNIVGGRALPLCMSATPSRKRDPTTRSSYTCSITVVRVDISRQWQATRF